MSNQVRRSKIDEAHQALAAYAAARNVDLDDRATAAEVLRQWLYYEKLSAAEVEVVLQRYGEPGGAKVIPFPGVKP